MPEPLKVPKSAFDAVLGRMLKADPTPASEISKDIERQGKSKPKKAKSAPRPEK